MKDLRKIYTKDHTLSKIQDNVYEFSQQLLNSPIIEGVLIKEIDLVIGEEKKIAHGLGREINGYLIVKKNIDLDLYISSVYLPTKFLTVTATKSGKVNLYVF